MSEDPHHLVIDKTTWPPGPWMDEPDRVQWDTRVGYPGLVVRNPFLGTFCGYVGVPPGHHCHEAHYDAVDVHVHGGLTYAAHCQVDGPICHVPKPGEPDDIWWLGFDCAHGWDFPPRLRLLPGIPPHLGLSEESYRDLAYVRREVEDLAAQLAAIRP